MKQNSVSVGLYRHFKGQYYYVTGLSKSATDEETIMVNYFNVCHPEYGSFVRPLEDFITDHDTKDNGVVTVYIRDRKDNVTGQHHRMERVKDLNFQLGSVSTEALIYELGHRKDSPLQRLDIKGLNASVFSTDYVVGNCYEQTEDTPRGVETIAVFETPEKAKECLDTHQHLPNTKVFKRTFIEVE